MIDGVAHVLEAREDVLVLEQQIQTDVICGDQVGLHVWILPPVRVDVAFFGGTFAIDCRAHELDCLAELREQHIAPMHQALHFVCKLGVRRTALGMPS